jgi:hypothetical protein
MTSWIVVPNLDEGRDQMNDRFPKRAKKAEGGIGDTVHQHSISSHNPDDEAGVSAEWNDGDSKHEVRARDFDKNLNDDNGVIMEEVVQTWVKLCRAGTMWWVRYIIYNGRIWHKRDGFKTHQYNGADQHTNHVHVNSDFSESADKVTGTNWHLAGITKSTPGSLPSHPPLLDVDGELGPKTIKRWQQVMGTPVDGKIDEKGSLLIKAVQKHLNALHVMTPLLKVDGEFGPKTIGAVQKYLKSPVDQFISKPKSQMVMALQRRLNSGKF